MGVVYSALTMLIGGGIVFDSDPYDEWMETMNKLAANIHCIVSAEERFGNTGEDEAKDLAESKETQEGRGAHVHLGDGS